MDIMNYWVLTLPFLLALYRILLTNVLVPYFKRKKLYQLLQTRADWSLLASNNTFLNQIFQHMHGKLRSKWYRLSRGIWNKEFIYGEIEVLPFFTLLEKTQPTPGEIFYDLGSGSGKAVFTAGLYFDLAKSCGIELLAPLYTLANNRVKQAQELAGSQDQLKNLATIQFKNDNFLNADFLEANIVYIAATCLQTETWEKLIDKLVQLQPGSRIIVASKQISHQRFTQIYQGNELMSWGLCPVTIYKLER
jgi:SAM-dependent methyltransferase